MKKKNIFHKVVVSAISLAMAVVMLAPMTAEAMSYQKKQVVYMTGKSGGWASIDVNDIAKGKKLLGASSSNKAVAKPSSYSNGNYSHEYKNLYNSDYSGSSSSRYGSIELDLFKTGKATIKFKVGKSKSNYKTYQTEVTVKKYENPMKSFKITGINSGKSISKKFASENWANTTLKKDLKDVKIQVSANTDKGWKIQSVEFDYNSDNGNRYASYGSKGVSSASLHVGTIEAKEGGNVWVQFVNTKTGGTMSCTYSISPKK